MPTLYANAPDAYTIRWSIGGLSSYFNTTYYQSAYVTNDAGTTLSYVLAPSSGTSYSTPSVDITSGVSPNSSYTLHGYVRAANGVAYLVGSITVYTPAPPKPSAPTITQAFATNSNTIYVQWSPVAGASKYQVYITGGTYQDVTGTEKYFTGLVAGTTYTISVSAYNGQWSDWSYRTVTTPVGAFSWTYPKTSGQSFNITAIEWRNLCTHINVVRGTKGLANYSFTTATQGGTFTADMYNQARNAINAMSPPTSIPPYRNRGDTINASDLNALVNSLNSIS